jgi:hypothetical protein
MLRAAQSRANDKYGLGGRVKEGRHAPRPITLAPTKG